MADGKVLLFSAHGSLLRRTQGNYKVSFLCINLRTLPCKASTCKLHLMYLTDEEHDFSRQFVFCAFTETVIPIQIARVYLYFYAILSKVRQTFLMDPRHDFILFEGNICIYIVRGLIVWPNVCKGVVICKT